MLTAPPSMPGAPVRLTPPAPIALVPGRTFAAKHAQARAQYPFLPDLPQLISEFNELTSVGGVAVTVDEPRGQKNGWIRLYARRTCVGVQTAPQGNAFVVEFIDPMNLRSHASLARSRLRVAPSRWLYGPAAGTVPPGCRAPDAQIRQAWQQLRQERRPDTPVERRPARYDAFCDTLDVVVEGARQIGIAKDQARPPLVYYEVRSAGDARRSTAGQYVFLLARPGQVQPGNMIELRQAPDLRGKVAAVDGERLTVHFDASVDRRRIPAQGELVLSGNDIVQRIQRDAIARLRSGATRNPRLLPLLVDAQFLAFAEQTTAQPAESLEGGQLTAFQRALAVPDLLLVLGPPGTGKTRTIVQIALAAAARGERVLITSQTNTAVDNVLERLPEAVTAIRVGNEERIADAVAPRTLSATATGMRQQILDRTQAPAGRYGPWLTVPSPASALLRLVTAAVEELGQRRSARESTAHLRSLAIADVEARLSPFVETARRELVASQRETTAVDGRIRRLETRLAELNRRSTGLLGLLSRWRAGRCRRSLDLAIPLAIQVHAKLDRAARDLADHTGRLRAAVDGADPTVRRRTEELAAADRAVDKAFDTLRDAVQRYARLLGGVVRARTVGENAAEISEFVDWCRQIDPILSVRARLLQEWRQQLAEPGDQLHAELVRYADVIGTTCIGVGVQKNMLSDLDVDVAVVDEAGQIPFPSTLVPLVRARRAVLVGDHHQLPPFVDDEVRQWLERDGALGSGTDPAQLTDLLTRSAFERLIDRAPAANQVLLDRQRRMPAVLANFVSEQFYGGRLATGTEHLPPSPLFRSALAVVDTADLPAAQRAERRRERTETWQAAGCDNLAEAKIVQDLVLWYARHERQWAVVAPYRAQVQLLTLRLREMLSDEAIRDRVGTVDAFQGKEYDIVLYSCTRSNAGGNIGFLRELRRLNVAITRSREQLILVGDVNTLVRARDPGFRQLARALHRYAERHGDVVASRDLRERLA